MKKIYFATTNAGKISALETCFCKCNIPIEVEGVQLPLIEPQSHSIEEVSRSKAKQAFAKLGKPLVVEDGGLAIEALAGFPGVYSRYILDTIGVDGVLRLMEGEENRACSFIGATTYVDEAGEMHSFCHDCASGLIAHQKSKKVLKNAWSDFFKIFYVPQFDKMLAELNEAERKAFWDLPGNENTLFTFSRWLAETR